MSRRVHLRLDSSNSSLRPPVDGIRIGLQRVCSEDVTTTHALLWNAPVAPEMLQILHVSLERGGEGGGKKQICLQGIASC